ncbi:HGxxPAAW family protein [Streptomyces polyrhachis]|uniref:HGxxPAAW family protein n=1 Tax=Streptomyces polyrhachis TaxID=1282885 RepID=A0ABW2G9V5_9ACTN
MAANNGHGADHGHTPAAWTGVIIAFVGFMVAGYFMVVAQPIGFWAGIALTLVGGLVGAAMKAAGMGKEEPAPHRMAG